MKKVMEFDFENCVGTFIHIYISNIYRVSQKNVHTGFCWSMLSFRLLNILSIFQLTIRFDRPYLHNERAYNY